MKGALFARSRWFKWVDIRSLFSPDIELVEIITFKTKLIVNTFISFLHHPFSLFAFCMDFPRITSLKRFEMIVLSVFKIFQNLQKRKTGYSAPQVTSLFTWHFSVKGHVVGQEHRVFYRLENGKLNKMCKCSKDGHPPSTLFSFLRAVRIYPVWCMTIILWSVKVSTFFFLDHVALLQITLKQPFGRAEEYPNWQLIWLLG